VNSNLLVFQRQTIHNGVGHVTCDKMANSRNVHYNLISFT